MAIYAIKEERLDPIKEKNIDFEKRIQSLTEKNLGQIFKLRFVSSEFSLKNFRLDTVAFDEEAKAFVIIEYKRDRSFSVVDQGYAYLSLMLNNKADFILEYNEQNKERLSRDNVDWSQSRVLFLAQSFTPYQQNAINFKDLPFELWEVKFFDNNTVLYNQLLATEARESIKTISKNNEVRKVAKELKVFAIADHLEKTNESMKEVFDVLRRKIFNLGSDVKEVPKKLYIAYKTSETNFVDLIFYSKEIRMTLNIESGHLSDPKALALDFTKPPKGHWGNGDYEFVIKSMDDLPYAMMLIEQSYSANSGI